MGYYSDTHRVTHYPDVIAESAANEVTLFKNIGDTAKGFMAMHKDAVADGAIDSDEGTDGAGRIDCHSL